jgi:hypothetical protein
VAGVRIHRAALGGAGLAVSTRDTLLGGESDLWLAAGGRTCPCSPRSGAARREHPERLAASRTPALRRSSARSRRPSRGRRGRLGRALRHLAALIAAAKAPVFVANRGWFDPTGQVPRLLVEIDRLLAGPGAGIVFLRTAATAAARRW